MAVALPAINPIHPPPVGTALTQLVGCALILLAAPFAWKGLRRRAIPWPPFAMPLLVLLAYILAREAISPSLYSEPTWMAVAYLAVALLGGITTISIARVLGRETVATVVASALLLAAFINSVFALVQIYGSPTSFLAGLIVNLDLTPFAGRAYGNSANPNLLGLCILLGLSGLAYLWSRRRIPNSTVPVIALILIWALVLTGSRWPPIALMGILAYTAVLRAGPETVRWQYGLAGLLIIYLVVAAVVASGGSGWGVSPLGRFFESASGDAGRAGARRHLWTHAWIAFTEAPLLGVGIGGYRGRMFENSERLAHMNVTGLDPNAHNLLLDLMAETGAIGALCAVAVLLVIAGTLVKRPPRARTLMAGSVLIVFMVHSAIEYPLWYAHLLVVFAIVISLDAPAKIQSVRRFVGPAIVAGLMLWWWLIATDYVELRSLTRAAIDPKTLGAFVQEREQGNARWTGGPLRPLKEMVLWQGIPLAAIEAKRAATELDRVAVHFPTEVLVFHHISALWMAGRHADAMTIAGHAAVAMPNVLVAIETEAERRRGLGESGWEGLADSIAKLRLERKIDGPRPH